MKPDLIYDYLERIGTVIRMEARRSTVARGLQPVQLEALHYLSSCNRYSNTPLAVAEYLGLTKGTVSQTLRVLEAYGLIAREVDARDRRVVHLVLTEFGQQAVADSIPPRTLQRAVETLPEDVQETVVKALSDVLMAMQHVNRLKTFGACKTCRHHRLDGESGNRWCGLTGEQLSPVDIEKICREHVLPEEDRLEIAAE